jgi:hypothetical protein
MGSLWCEERAKHLLRMAWWWRRRDGRHCHMHMCTRHVSPGVPTGSSAAVHACWWCGNGGGEERLLGRIEWWRSEVRHYYSSARNHPPPEAHLRQDISPANYTSHLLSHNYVARLARVTMALPLPLRNRNNRRSWLPWAKKEPTMNHDEATFWLSQFIGKNLRIHASDGRVFGGQMKCTDKVS